jgi:hypothetical protein
MIVVLVMGGALCVGATIEGKGGSERRYQLYTTLAPEKVWLLDTRTGRLFLVSTKESNRRWSIEGALNMTPQVLGLTR